MGNLASLYPLQTALVEAVSIAQLRRRTTRLVGPLETALRKAFIRQGALLAKELRTVRRYFSEGPVDPYQQHSDWLAARFSEAVPPTEWLAIWAAVRISTIKLFSQPIDEAVKKALEYGGMAIIAELKMNIDFDVKDPFVVDYLREYGARQVSRINEHTFEVLQSLVTQAADEGWSYQRTAEAIIERFKEFAIGKPQLHIDSRAHLIAVTEVGNAYAEGQLQIGKKLSAAGLDIEKKWFTVGDDRVSAGCKENEAAGWIGIDEAFPSGHTRPLRFPGCRCDMLQRRKKEKG